jgi:hypothetical protein
MTAIGPIVYAFFEQHLKAKKGLSPASVRSYRDALRLFLSFVAAERGRSLTRITVEDFTAERVRHFLGHLETCRGNHIRSRNQRLAGLHTFFNYLARQVPEALAEAERVAAIPRKRAPPPPTLFLARLRLRPTRRVSVGVIGCHSRRSEAEPERAFGTRGTVDTVAPVAGFMTSSGKPGGSVGPYGQSAFKGKPARPEPGE